MDFANVVPAAFLVTVAVAVVAVFIVAVGNATGATADFFFRLRGI